MTGELILEVRDLVKHFEVGGGLFGLAAIGCLTVTVLFALVWRS